MSKVTLPYSLTPHTTAKSAEVMADLNAILAVLNGGIDVENLVQAAQAGLVKASKSLKLTAAYQLLPGCEKTLVLTDDCTVVVIALCSASGSPVVPLARVTIDGTVSSEISLSEEGGLSPPATILGAKDVSAGARTIKLEAKQFSGSGETFIAQYVYLVLPR